MIEEKKYVGYGYHGGGRPTKEEKRKKVVGIRLTDKEYQQLEEMAKAENLTISAFCLKQIFR